MKTPKQDEWLDKILKTYQLDIASNLSQGKVLDIERDKARKEAKQAIANHIKQEVGKAIPNKIRSNSAFVQVADSTMREFKQAEANGYNRAINEIRTNLATLTKSIGESHE